MKRSIYLGLTLFGVLLLSSNAPAQSDGQRDADGTAKPATDANARNVKASTTSKSSRQQWEYKIGPVTFHSSTSQKLNQLGREGWELVEIADGMGVFKRKRAAPEVTGQDDVQLQLLKALGATVMRGKAPEVNEIASAIRKIEQRPTVASTLLNSQLRGGARRSSPSSQRTKEFAGLKKDELKAMVIKLHNDHSAAKRKLMSAMMEATKASRAYDRAEDKDKAALLILQLEAEAHYQKPRDKYSELRADLESAKKAYLLLLNAE